MLEDFAIFGAKADLVTGGSGSRVAGSRKGGFEKAFRAQPRHGDLRWRKLDDQLRFRGARLEEADNPARALFARYDMRPEHAEGIGVSGGQERIDCGVLLDRRGWLGGRGVVFWHGSILAEVGCGTNERKGKVGSGEGRDIEPAVEGHCGGELAGGAIPG